MASQELERQLQHLRGVLQRSQALNRLGTWEWSIPGGTFEWSDVMFEILGLRRDEIAVTLSTYLERMHPDDRGRAEALLERMLADARPAEIDHRVVLPDGSVRHVFSTAETVVDEAGKVVGLFGTVQDVTEHHDLLEAARESERFSRAVLDASDAQTAVLEADGTIVTVNRAWSRFAVEHSGDESLGVGANYLEVARTAAGKDSEGGRRAADGIGSVLARTSERFTMDYRMTTPDGLRWYTLVCTPLGSSAGGAVVAHTDITARVLAEQALEHQALHDALTGLPNRLLLVDRITHALERQKRGGGLTALLFLDLDRFKIVNDSLGHATGDALLVEAAERLRATVRSADTVGRFGGDEFLVLCEDLQRLDEAVIVARRIVDSLGRVTDLSGRKLYLSVSVGIAVADAPGIDAETLVANADAAMYAAKADSRSSIVLFDDALRRTAVDRLVGEHELRAAIEQGELRLHYQPYVDLASGEVVGAEALVRWQHPTRGLLTPAEFIAVAEDTGLIVPLGRWVMKEACRQIAAWGDEGPLGPSARVSLNVSAREVADLSLADTIQARLAASGVASSRICLELTETAVMRDPATTTTVLGDLRNLGVNIAIDDFGTGHASLAYLSRFRADLIKVDRAFISVLESDPSAEAIVASVVALADTLGLKVVAEGIETEEQHRRLRALGVHYGQGFLFARPQPAADLAA